MASAAEHPSSEFVRLLVMGPAGSGKTGSLLSLLLAGMKVNVIDMDNGLDWLVGKLKRDHPDKLPLLDYQTFRDKKNLTQAGPVNVGIPNAYTRAVSAMGKWDDGTNPQEWGRDRVLVLDSLTFFGSAAYNWKDALNPKAKDKRQIFYDAQDAVVEVLDALTSPAFRTNVIVFTHVKWHGVVDENGNKTITKGYPSSIGTALDEKLGTYFNTLGLFETTGSGGLTKRVMHFHPTGLIDLKSAAPMPSTPLPVESALSTFFKAARAG